MNRLRAVGAAGLAVLLAACTSSPGGSSTPGGSASATPALSAAPVEAVAPGEAVKTTSADVAGFDVAQHAVDTSKASPDRLAVTSAALVITVPNWVLHTASALTGTRLSRSVTSVRTKTMPVLAGAGLTETRVWAPVCTPTPAKIAGPCRVC